MLTGKTDPGAGPYGLVLTGPRTYAASGGVVMCVNVNLVRFLSVRLSLGCATWNVNSWVMLPSHCGGRACEYQQLLGHAIYSHWGLSPMRPVLSSSGITEMEGGALRLSLR